LFSDSESGNAKQQDSDDKNDIYAAGGTMTWQKQNINPTLNTGIPRYSALQLALFRYSALVFFTEVQYYTC
jgi:type V secretory pathway adhesin AidA